MHTTQEPPIDSSSNEGMVPETFDSTIQFKEVDFSYPTRPDVQVRITTLPSSPHLASACI